MANQIALRTRATIANQQNTRMSYRVNQILNKRTDDDLIVETETLRALDRQLANNSSLINALWDEIENLNVTINELKEK